MSVAAPSLPRNVLGLLGPLAPLLGLVVVVLVFFAIPPHAPISLFDLRTVSVHTVITGIAALGMTLVIMGGGLDLSVGSVIALSSVLAAIASRAGWTPGPAIGAAVAAGTVCGVYNGLLITMLRLPPFIATLGTLGFFRGVAKWISSSRPVSADPGWLAELVSPIPGVRWLVVAPGVWIMLALAGLTTLLVRRTVFGRHVLAIGSREETARLCGVRIGSTKVLMYAVAGASFGLAGLMQFGRLTQGDPTVAIGLELDVIAAVVIGGASLSGGQGSVLGTIAGAFLMAYMRNRCTVYGWPNFVQEMIVGHVIIIAVAIDQLRRGAGGAGG